MRRKLQRVSGVRGQGRASRNIRLGQTHMQAAFPGNHFELFQLPVGFDIDLGALTARYRDLQRSVHPDRFASAPDRDRRTSMQAATQLNDAFQTLKDPMRRARYMLELAGVHMDDQDTAMEPEFLMEQMELREALDEAKHSESPEASINRLMVTVGRLQSGIIDQINEQFARGDDRSLEVVAVSVRKLQFLTRLREEIEELEDELSASVDD